MSAAETSCARLAMPPVLLAGVVDAPVRSAGSAGAWPLESKLRSAAPSGEHPGAQARQGAKFPRATRPTLPSTTRASGDHRQIRRRVPLQTGSGPIAGTRGTFPGSRRGEVRPPWTQPHPTAAPSPGVPATMLLRPTINTARDDAPSRWPCKSPCRVSAVSRRREGVRLFRLGFIRKHGPEPVHTMLRPSDPQRAPARNRGARAMK